MLKINILFFFFHFYNSICVISKYLIFFEWDRMINKMNIIFGFGLYIDIDNIIGSEPILSRA